MASRKKVDDPAKVNYFFGPGWKQLGAFLAKFWELNKEDVRKRKEKLENKGKHKLSLQGMGGLIYSLSMVIFGTLFFVLLGGGVSVILAAFFLLFYVLMFVIWLTDRIYLLTNRIFVACPSCKEKSLIPAYVCPSCGARHQMLAPGRYGGLYRRCNCGAKLSSHFLTKRSQLEAHCPHCDMVLNGVESRPICVPIVGGRSAGKTAFITAFAHDFIESEAPRAGLAITHYSDETRNYYENVICSDYVSGQTHMTATENDINAVSSKAFSFIIADKKLHPDRLVQVYDVAGESFVNQSENEQQLQYNYCHGIVFIIDPLSIREIYNRLDETADVRDAQSLGTEDLTMVLDAFLNKLRVVTGKSESKKMDVPLALVISKCDLPILQEDLGEDRIEEMVNAAPEGSEISRLAAQEELCRQFLREYMPDFMQNVDMKFEKYRCFCCSAIGHTRETGKFEPKGVLDSMEWIFSEADADLQHVWNRHSFAAKKWGAESV